MNLLVTHNTINSERLEKKANELGVNILFQSLITTAAVPISAEDINFLNNSNPATGILFTSANGVEHFFDLINQGTILLNNVKFISSGEKTSAALLNKGVSNFASTQIGGEKGIRSIDFSKLSGLNRIVYITSEKAENGIMQFIQATGIECRRINFYNAIDITAERLFPLIELLHKKEIGTVFFTSPSSVKAFFKMIESETNCDQEKLLEDIGFAAIGEVTGCALEQFSKKSFYIGEGRSIENELIRCLEILH